ncbi:MAG: laccase domain protein [Candidatus Parcubacteria bacterium]|nr:MAG: laccase domain protein [Candidatus Parcubacteria bacterium]
MINNEFINIEKRRLETLENEEFKKLMENLGIKHLFTTKNFGHIDIDDTEVFRKIAKTLNIYDLKIVFAGQPHGKEICLVDGNQKIMYGYDGLFTEEKNVALVIRSADCLPILISAIYYNDNDKTPKIIGALHAGRRGLVDGIIEVAIDFLLKRGFNQQNIYFLIGPHICGKCYDLERDNEQTINLINQVGKQYFRFEHEQVFFDMLNLAKDQILNKNIPEKNIYQIPICTYENSLLFPSYRYNKKHEIKNSLFGSIICIRN